MKAIKLIILIIALVLALLGLHPGCDLGYCMETGESAPGSGKKGENVSITRKLEATAIQHGTIPTAMQWKRAAVFATGERHDSNLLQFLRDLEEAGWDSILTPPETDLAGSTDVHVHLLFGWSPGGRDELRWARLDSAVAQDCEIRIYASRPEVQLKDSAMGTADMRFIGWDVEVGNLEPGQYSAKLFINRNTIRTGIRSPPRIITVGEGYKLVKEINFKIRDFP